jgi:NTP pyrophosphatase (non-canonical NTP hydrolase)
MTRNEPRKIAKPEGTILLREYASEIASTDKLSSNDLQPVLMGLFGEVGSLMATSKKRLRDEDAYTEYYDAVCEEFGDVLWYLGAICRRLKINLEDVFFHASNSSNYNVDVAASDFVHSPLSRVLSVSVPRQLQDTLIRLGEAASFLLQIEAEDKEAHRLLNEFAHCYLQAIQAVGVPFSTVVRGNIHKTQGRFIKPNLVKMPVFDAKFEREEQLPWEFEIEITQRKSGQSYLRWNDVFIGDPLSDNILDEDGYRFHDIFHLAHAAVLHWSPTFRALIKQKRKSNEVIDKAQDGGRAIVIEEGLTAYIFSRAKKLEFFAQQDHVSYDLLKTIQQFVRGYEVEDCPPSLWEIAILQGYAVFRQVREKGGGRIIGNRKERTIIYKASSEG